MDHRVNILKGQFSDISSIINDNEKIFRLLESRIVRLKTTYEEFIINNKDKLFVFGLDSFHFQGKLIDIEYDDMVRMYNAILNRMYCEYYKLYKIVIQYINDSVQDSKIKEMSKLNIFPIYLDLEPFKQYGFETIQNLHENILELLVTLGSYLRNKELELSKYQKKNRIGLSIENFVNTFRYNNVIMEERIMLFIAYIEFFHKMHNKYLVRFLTKIKLMYSQVSHDIRFDDNAKLGRDEKVNMIYSLKGDHVERDIIHTIKDYITDLGSGSDVDSETSIYESGDASTMSSSGLVTPSRVQFQNITMKIEEAENEKDETSSVKSLIKSYEGKKNSSNSNDKLPILEHGKLYKEVPIIVEVSEFQSNDVISQPGIIEIEKSNTNVQIVSVEERVEEQGEKTVEKTQEKTVEKTEEKTVEKTLIAENNDWNKEQPKQTILQPKKNIRNPKANI
jgi:hypothetical protein